MRYYQVVITVPSGMSGAGNVLVPNAGGKPGFTPVEPGQGVWSYCSLLPGSNVYTPGGTNPAAQQFDCDMPLAAMHTPKANTHLSILGVGLAEIAQASYLNYMDIQVYGGMAAGLPLANPAQVGLLAQGQIIRSFGNWVGTAQALEIYIAAGGSSASSAQTTGNPNTASTTPLPATNETPCNLVFQWKAGQPLLAALAPALATAFPQYTIVGAVSPNLVWQGATTTGFYARLEQFAEFLQQKTLSMLQGWAPNTALYPGVSITLRGNVISVYDGTTQLTPKALNFQDLIGQPSWNGPATVQVTTVLRGDLDPGGYVTLPDTIFTTGVAAQSQSAGTYNGLKLSSVFQGAYQVKSVRHVGNSRGPGMVDWATVLDLVNVGTPSGNAVANYPVLIKSAS